MIRRTIVAVTVLVIALLVPAAVAGASDDQSSLGAPQAAGLLPADAPPTPEPSPVAPLLQAAGLVLLLGGAIVVGSSWVSPAEAV